MHAMMTVCSDTQIEQEPNPSCTLYTGLLLMLMYCQELLIDCRKGQRASQVVLAEEEELRR